MGLWALALSAARHQQHDHHAEDPEQRVTDRVRHAVAERGHFALRDLLEKQAQAYLLDPRDETGARADADDRDDHVEPERVHEPQRRPAGGGGGGGAHAPASCFRLPSGLTFAPCRRPVSRSLDQGLSPPTRRRPSPRGRPKRTEPARRGLGSSFSACSGYFFRRRPRPTPKSPRPSSASVPGSGTLAYAWLSLSKAYCVLVIRMPSKVGRPKKFTYVLDEGAVWLPFAELVMSSPV